MDIFTIYTLCFVLFDNKLQNQKTTNTSTTYLSSRMHNVLVFLFLLIFFNVGAICNNNNEVNFFVCFCLFEAFVFLLIWIFNNKAPFYSCVECFFFLCFVFLTTNIHFSCRVRYLIVESFFPYCIETDLKSARDGKTGSFVFKYFCCFLNRSSCTYLLLLSLLHAFVSILSFLLNSVFFSLSLCIILHQADTICQNPASNRSLFTRIPKKYP